MTSEEAPAVLGPSGFAQRAVFRAHGGTLRQCERQGVARELGGDGGMNAFDQFTTCIAKVSGRDDECCRNRDNESGAADRAEMEDAPAHQWNICAVPG